jgi:RNA polymerase sigma-70 factor (ECF subfamily)
MDTPHIISYEVVQRAQAGDELTSREIIEKLHQPLLGFIYRILGPSARDQKEDIAQDVFLKVFRALDRFDVNRGVRFSTWVFTFARNHCLDLLKKRRIKAFSLSRGRDDEAIDVEDPTARDPASLAFAAEIADRIDTALQTINPEQREVFEMRERRGMDYGEIARTMGVAEGTVKSRLHRARIALRDILADINPGGEPAIA